MTSIYILRTLIVLTFDKRKLDCFGEKFRKSFCRCRNNVSCLLIAWTNRKNCLHSANDAGCRFLRFSNRLVLTKSLCTSLCQTQRELSSEVLNDSISMN